MRRLDMRLRRGLWLVKALEGRLMRYFLCWGLEGRGWGRELDVLLGGVDR